VVVLILGGLGEVPEFVVEIRKHENSVSANKSLQSTPFEAAAYRRDCALNWKIICSVLWFFRDVRVGPDKSGLELTKTQGIFFRSGVSFY
jgi:hypothetical protein